MDELKPCIWKKTTAEINNYHSLDKIIAWQKKCIESRDNKIKELEGEIDREKIVNDTLWIINKNLREKILSILQIKAE
jgi:hypothetical protein